MPVVAVVTTLPGTCDAGGWPKAGSKRKCRAAKKAKTRTVSADLADPGPYKLKVKKLKRGQSYKLSLDMKSADCQRASDTAKLKIKK